ncbi:hypothetical protein HIM_03054 [Hirsutella minnesotensis 3608]|nr:hypothetical protein HIM_03054 [Hirsutella minnesotensis 3608]
MTSAQDSLLDIERHRLQLEENIEQLRKALQHWQTWDAEYEALKEEVEEASERPDEEQELRRIHGGFEGELLRRKELDEIFGFQGSRSSEQVVNVLQRRIDYVGKNIGSLQKQLEAAEDRHAAAITQSQPDAVDENAEPITEIIEELDDDDNILSYRLNRPGDSVSHIREALEKAGVTDLPNGEPDLEKASEEVPSSADTKSQPTEPQPRHATDNLETSSQFQENPKKTVSFVEDVNNVDAPASAPAPPQEMSRRAKRVESIMKTAKEQESISKQDPVIPDDEEPEDALLRQQMLQYSMGEVGAVVAELELEEPGDEADFDYGYDESEDDDDDGDEEDRYGRSTGRVVTDAYRRRMLELEKKLGIKSHQNQALEAQGSDSGSDDDEGIGRIVIKRDHDQPSASKTPPLKSSLKDRQGDANGKKGVRFAQSLDVAPSDVDAMAPVKEREEPLVEPLSDIVERAGLASASGPQPEPKASRKPSRFKKTMGSTTSSGEVPKGPIDVPSRLIDRDTSETLSSGPEGVTLANTLVEREPTSQPQAPDELNESLDYNAVAGEYHALRKRFIQRQGGFLQEDTSPVQEIIDDEEMAEPISRFKAARLSRQ